MNDSAVSIREVLRTPGRVAASPEPVRQGDADSEYRPFANGRVGNRAQVTLVFRKKDGSVRGFSYLHFFGIESDNPAEGFSIEFSHVRVTITGRNLEPLFQMLCQHRVAEIRETDRTQLFATGEQEPVVERIDFKNNKSGELTGR